MIPFLDLKREIEHIKPEILSALKKVTDSGHYIFGNEVKKFEKEIAKYLKVKYAIGVASGSDALLLSLMALDIKPGDEVITTPFTFFATASCITRLGATPVFVDINPRTFNIDPALIEKAITKKTKAIIPVHLYGQAAEMNKIIKIAKKHKIPVVEDACQAIGAEYKNKKLGTLGIIGCFSFYPTKNLGAHGDAGLIVTNDKRLYERMNADRMHGSKIRYYHESIGINSRLDEYQAAILRIKLKHLDKWNEKRISIAKSFTNALKKHYLTPEISPGNKHVFHQYTLLTKKRDPLLKLIRKKGVWADIYYPLPLHLQKCFKYLNYKKGDFPISEKIAKEIISIPIHPFLKTEEISKIIKVLREIKESFKNA